MSENIEFKVIQEWDGRVQEVLEDSFCAIIEDKTNPDNYDEIVEIKNEILSEADVQSLEPGSLFSWKAGYCEIDGVQSRPISKIKFLELPKWTQEEIDMGIKEGDRMYDLLCEENNNI